MTGSLFVTGRGVGPIGRHAGQHSPALGGTADLTHAVTRPVVDGLESSVCGVLVTATATEDWRSPGVARRCEECARIAG